MSTPRRPSSTHTQRGIPRYNAVFAEIGDVLALAGLSRD